MRPLEWFNALLKRHKLEKPDGRPLYQYRLTDDEYAALHESLKLSPGSGINNVTRWLYWDAAFVVYAADWWRRHYNGNWGWGDIFSSIGLDYQDLNVGRRNDLVELGLHRWHREVRTFNDIRRYLGTIATEGGLPLRQLTEAGGWLERVLKPVVRNHITNGYSIQSLIESYKDSIPNAFSGDEVMAILTDVVQVTVGLREKYKLHEQANPAAYLDSILPTWREKFPLPINDKIAASLLSDLIQAASDAKPETSPASVVGLKRVLIRPDSERPEVTLSVDIPVFIELKNIGLAADVELPPNLDMELCSSNGKVYPLGKAIQTQKLGEIVLRTFCAKAQITGTDALLTYTFHLKYLGIVIHSKPIVETATLDCDIPWLFKNIDEKWILQGAATQSTSQENVFTYIPNRLSLDYAEGSSVISFGKIFEGNIYKLHGVITCKGELESYKLSAGKVDTAQQYDLVGKQLPYPTIPTETYIGVPELIRLNSLTGQTVNKGSSELIAKPIGSDKPWQKITDVGPGNYEVRLLDGDGVVVLRKRIALLPSELCISLKADRVDAKSGEIILENIDDMDVSIHNSDLHVTKNTIDNGISIEAQAEDSPPSNIKISLRGIGHKNNIVLTLPFPARGAILRDAKGKKVSNASNLYLEGLYGYRIHYYDERQNVHRKKTYLDFRLIDFDIQDEQRQDIYIKGKISLVGEITTLSVNDWKETIVRLLSVSRSLDAAVRITLIVDSQEKIALTIKQYAHSLEVDYRTGLLVLSSHSLNTSELEAVTNTNIVPINLTAPHKQQTLLNPLRSEGVATGEWLFDMDVRDGAPWILFPSKDSPLQFRPVLWLVSGGGENADCYDCALVSAIAIENMPEREVAIRNVLIEMAKDKYHTGWDYISSLWENTSHLPLTTFDLWRVAVTEPKFMAQLLLGTKNEVVTKIKAELPIMWALTPLSVWIETLQRLKAEYEINLDDVILINELLDKKINILSTLGNSFNGLIQILQSEILDKKLDGLDVEQSRREFLAFTDYKYNDFKCKHADEEQWPRMLRGRIGELYNDSLSETESLIMASSGKQISSVYLPFVLAFQAISNKGLLQSSSPTEIFKIKCIIDFDNDWFDEIYSITTKWLFVKNIYGAKK